MRFVTFTSDVGAADGHRGAMNDVRSGSLVACVGGAGFVGIAAPSGSAAAPLELRLGDRLRPRRGGRVKAASRVGGALALALAACGGEAGQGRAFGTLDVPYCEGGRPYASGSETLPADDYNLDPGFIAGEPFEDVRRPPRQNRLVLRLQPSGKRVESDDVLTFDFVDSYEIARCLWGRTLSDGTPDYDATFCLPTQGMDGTRVVNGAILNLSRDTPLRAYFTPRGTCGPVDFDLIPNLVATAVTTWPMDAPPPPGPSQRPDPPQRPAEVPQAWESWVAIVAFGGAEGWRGRPCDAGCERSRRSFKVDFGSRVRATGFHLVMMDDRYLEKLKDDEPPGRPEIRARLMGEFDIDLARGQGAQTFP